MPWVGTIPDTDGLYHFYPPDAKVRKTKIKGNELLAYLRKGGERIEVRWVDQGDSAEDIESKNASVAAKMVNDAKTDVYFANSKVHKLRVQKVQIPSEINSAYEKVKKTMRHYSDAVASRNRMLKEYEQAKS